MGLFFTLLYILVAYLTPEAILGPASADYHVEVILAIPTIIASVFALQDSGITKMSQTLADIGLIGAIILSMIFSGWFGGAISAVLINSPALLAFFFVAINCRKKGHLQLLVLVMLTVTVFVTIQGYIGENSGIYDRVTSYYVFQRADNRIGFWRIRGQGIIQDPNDFAQFIMALIPCLFFFWKKNRVIGNVLLVYAPLSFVLWGLFLTHSRGAMLAAAVALVVGFRKKLSLVGSGIAGILLIAGLTAAGFSGGRDISASNGEDRLGAWGAGLEMIKHRGIFGVGCGRFTEYYYMTAHNSVVVCAAEIGIVGLFFWLLFIVPCVRDMYVLNEFTEKENVPEPEARTIQSRGLPKIAAANFPGYAFGSPAFATNTGGTAAMARMPAFSAGTTTHAPDLSAIPLQFRKDSGLSHHEIRRMAGLVLVTFATLLTTGWFLSRAYSMIFYVYGGVAVAVFRMAHEAGMEVPAFPLKSAAKWSALLSIVLLVAVYVLLRVEHLLGH